jgi:hypothetical protein
MLLLTRSQIHKTILHRNVMLHLPSTVTSLCTHSVAGLQYGLLSNCRQVHIQMLIDNTKQMPLRNLHILCSAPVTWIDVISTNSTCLYLLVPYVRTLSPAEIKGWTHKQGAPVVSNWQGKTELFGGKRVPVPPCRPQTPRTLACDWTPASAVTRWRQTTRAVPRPDTLILNAIARHASHRSVTRLNTTKNLNYLQDRQCTYNVTLRRVRESLLQWNSKTYSIFCCMCECVRACSSACVHVALIIQHATRMLHIVTCFGAPLAPSHFSILSHKGRNFRKKLTECEMRVLICSTVLSGTFLILRRI